MMMTDCFSLKLGQNMLACPPQLKCEHQWYYILSWRYQSTCKNSFD